MLILIDVQALVQEKSGYISLEALNDQFLIEWLNDKF